MVFNLRGMDVVLFVDELFVIKKLDSNDCIVDLDFVLVWD